MANQYKNKVVYNGATLIDLSDTTAVQSDVASGKIFYLATGEKVEGTASGGGSTRTTIVPEQTGNYTERYNQVNFVAPLVIGEVYIYTIDGVESQSTAFDNYGTVGLGSPDTTIGFDYGNGVMYLSIADTSLRTTHTIKIEQESSGSETTYDNIVPLQTINCTVGLSNDAYGGYINPYISFTEEGEKYRVIFDDTTYEPLTATYYGSGTNYLYVGDPNVEASSGTTLVYPFEVMLYGGQTFYLGVKGSGSHTLQVDKITSEGSGGGSGGGDTASNPLKGKIATFTGDSICQGAGYAGGYAKIIGEDYDMTVENIGVSDGTVVQWQNKFCISESIADMRSDADYVILEGGGNDADWGPQYIPVGTLSSGYNDTLDTTTFAGAFETMLKSAIARFPNAKIGYIFPHKCIAAFDAPNGAYHTMAISALEKWGIPYCDLNVIVPPLGYIDDLKTTYTRGDGIHPNEAGYRTFYAPKIVAFMQTMLTDKTLINKTVTTNGTYLASDDDADGYDSVTVNVSGGGGSSKNVQTAQSTDRRNNTTLGSIVSLTCSTAGTYDVYWTCTRSSTSGTWGSQLYINGTAYGTENTTWSNNVQNNHLTGVVLSANDTVAVYGRSRSGYYIHAPQLTIVQTA